MLNFGKFSLKTPNKTTFSEIMTISKIATLNILKSYKENYCQKGSELSFPFQNRLSVF